jgi:hypothetical protein
MLPITRSHLKYIPITLKNTYIYNITKKIQNTTKYALEDFIALDLLIFLFFVTIYIEQKNIIGQMDIKNRRKDHAKIIYYFRRPKRLLMCCFRGLWSSWIETETLSGDAGYLSDRRTIPYVPCHRANSHWNIGSMDGTIHLKLGRVVNAYRNCPFFG